MIRLRHESILALLVCALIEAASAGDARITIHAGETVQRVSPWLTGACIEDVNHEIYGGLYSQMIFGESFQEPAPTAAPKGFAAYDGAWSVKDGELSAGPGRGPKLISELAPFSEGETSVEVFFSDNSAGNAGLIVRVGKPGVGADNFDGYEVSLDVAAQALVLGRHRHNWEPIKNTPFQIPLNQWITLAVRMTETKLEALVNGESVIAYEDTQHPLKAGAVGVRNWMRPARYRNLVVKTGGEMRTLVFERVAEAELSVSGMWRAVKRGTVTGKCTVADSPYTPFVGKQYQRIEFTGGDGEIGVENMGLNRWGLHLVKDQLYFGEVWARAEADATLAMSLESHDGAKRYAEVTITLEPGEWRRLPFAIKPNASDARGRFAITLKAPGAVSLGYAFLQPDEWGRFKGLPVRRDVAEAMIGQGITLLRYGGSMVNENEYRWKKMIGPRERRPPYKGMWYPYSSNGWGILDFLNFCEAAGFEGIPAFNMNETPQDMAEFVEYAFAQPGNTGLGRKRMDDGHVLPYKLKAIQLGNEERVDDAYFAKFKALAEAIWLKAPGLILVVGDFAYNRPIQDPFNFSGADSRITSLAAHQKILELAKKNGREVWFDVHVWTEGPKPSPSQNALASYVDALEKISDGAKHKVAVFEFNANNHAQRRALGNASAIMTCERLGEKIVVAASANCLQPDGQNDNGWDQGLVFLNPLQVWLQPPGYVTQMVARNFQPLLVKSEIQNAGGNFDATVKRSADGKTLVLQAVNFSDKPLAVEIVLDAFKPSKDEASVEELAGGLNDRNSAQSPNRIVPKITKWKHKAGAKTPRYEFAPHSFTVVRFE